MDQTLSGTRMRLRLQYAEQISFVQSEAVGTGKKSVARVARRSMRLIIHHHHHAFPLGSCFASGIQSGRTCSDDGYAGLHVGVFVYGLGSIRRRRIAQSRHLADLRLSQMPHTGIGEIFVVPTDGHHPIELLSNGQVIEIQRGPRVLMFHRHPRARWSDAGPDVGNSIHVHQAIRTVAGAAQQPARPVIFEAASENPLTGAIKRRCYRIAFLDGDCFSVKADIHC